MNKVLAYLTAVGTVSVALFALPTQALATACPAPTSCTVGGITYTETGGTSGNGLTFLAEFSPGNQSNNTIKTDVLAYLTAYGYTGVDYLGRQDGSGLVGGDHITVAGGSQSGTWTLSPGTTNDIGVFIAIHAGGGQTTDLYKINNPGLSGTWSTFNGHDLSNFDLFGIDPPAAVPEPLTISLFGAGLAGAFGLRRRKKNNA